MRTVVMEGADVAGHILVIGKLCEKVRSIQKQNEDGAPVTFQQSREIGMLFEKCSSGESVVCCAAADGLVSLVISGTCDFNTVLQRLLSLVPSAKNLLGLVKSVSGLMVLQVLSSVKDDGSIQIPYGIRSPPHPLVSLLSQRPDSWSLLLQQLRALLDGRHERLQPHVVSLLAPFLRFVLLEPQASDKYAVFRVALVTMLLQGSEVKVIHQALLQELAAMIPCFQIYSRERVIEADLFLSQFLTVCLAGQDALQPCTLEQLVETALTICRRELHYGLDPSSLLERVLHLLPHLPQVAPRLVYHVAELMLVIPRHMLSYVIQIGDLLLDRAAVSSQRHLVAVLLLPLLQSLSMPSVVTVETGRPGCHSAASQLLKKIEQLLSEDKTESVNEADSQPIRQNCCLDSSVLLFDNYCHLASCTRTAVKWLNILTTTLAESGSKVKVTPSMTCLVASLCLTLSEGADLDLVLTALRSLCKYQPDKCGGFFPVVMYRLGREKDPGIRLSLLKCIPKLATQKSLVPPILKTIQTLSASPPLKPLALTLMTSLWQEQERVFPYLQRMLEDSGREVILGNQLDPLLLARAQCIKEICINRPSQHGVDVLPSLSAILNECTSPQQATPAALALQGLCALCQSEVVDIQTTWAVISAKLQKEARSLVLVELCQFFALVPQLQVETNKFQIFEQEVVAMLWKYTANSDSSVASAAFKSLAAFSKDLFQLRHLPDKVTNTAKENLLKSSDDVSEEDIEKATPPGDCYLKLMQLQPLEVLPAYRQFLTALLEQEVGSLPKHVYHSARQQQSYKDKEKGGQGIPVLLKSKYDALRQPALRPHMAVGMLLSYAPVVEGGRDGRPNKVVLAKHGRGYHQTLYSLLNEVSVLPGDWLCGLTLPQGWVAFMDRCFLAYLQGRKAELDLDLQRGRVKDMEEHEIQQRSAWLWARDKLLDLIKSSSKGSPAVQANCVGALVGLVLSINRFTADIDAGSLKQLFEEASEYITHKHWMTLALQTLLAIVDPAFKPTVRVWPLGGQRAGDEGGIVASVLARGMCCISISHLVPLILTNSPDYLLPLVAALETGLPGQPDSDHSSHLQMYYGQGLGSVLARLFQEQYTDVAGTEGLVAVWRAVNSLESACYGDSPHRLGSMLGLGMCLSAMCEDGKTDSRVHVTSALEHLVALLDTLEPETDIYEGLCLAYASTSANAYRCNIVSMESVNQHVAKLYQIHMQNPAVVGGSVSLGLLFDFLLRAGHPSVADLSQTVMESWMRAAEDNELAWSDRLVPLGGLFMMAGIHNLWLPGSLEASPGSSDVSNRELVKVASQILSSSSCDPSLQGNCAWMLGSLYASMSHSSENTANVPGSYKYLGDGSVLRPSVDMLITAGKQAMTELNLSHVTLVLKCLAQGPKQPLPPLNWATVLAPFLRMSHESVVQEWALEISLKQAGSSASAALLLSCWVIPPLSHSLQEASVRLTFEHMPTIIRVVPSGKLQTFLECSVEPLLSSSSEDTIGMQSVAMYGLQGALHVPDPPQSVMMVLYESLQRILHSVPLNDQGSLPVYHLLGLCLKEVPDDRLDNLMEPLESEQGHPSLRDLAARCILVATGMQPLQLLNPALELFMYAESSPEDVVAWLLLSSFQGNKTAGSEHSSVAKHQQWILELMGHQKNMAGGVIEMAQGMKLEKVLRFGFLILSCAVVSWSNTRGTFLQLLDCQGENPKLTPVPSGVVATVTAMFPAALENLVGDKMWQTMAPKLLDWLLFMSDKCTGHAGLRILQQKYLGSLHTLRHSKDFSKMAVWTRVYGFDLPSQESPVRVI